MSRPRMPYFSLASTTMSRKVEPCAAVMRTFSQSDSADHRRGLSGDGGLVDRGHALDHVSVGGDEVSCLDQNHLSRPKLAGRRRHDEVFPIDDELGLGLLAGLAQACGLRLAASLSHG